MLRAVLSLLLLNLIRVGVPNHLKVGILFLVPVRCINKKIKVIILANNTFKDITCNLSITVGDDRKIDLHAILHGFWYLCVK